MRTSNPALNEKTFLDEQIASGPNDVMTLDGTINKTLLSVGITVFFACVGYVNPWLVNLILLGVIAAIIISLVVLWKPRLAPLLTPLYAGVEGTVLGVFSRAFETEYEGIVFQALTLTIGVLASLLVLYKSGRIQVTDGFRRGVCAASLGIMTSYLLIFVLWLCGFELSLGHGILSIGISFCVAAVAALNLVLDFDFIEKGAKSGTMPKYMEWYGAFGLLITLVWVYVEIVRLLMKLRKRR
jgi:uncharacterized YccA/Bax inhibitor family protein